MSLDLLKEFGDPSSQPQNTSNYTDPQNTSARDEDEFGEFEQANFSKPPQQYGGRRNAFPAETKEHQDLLLVDTELGPPSPSPSFQGLNGPLKLVIPLDKTHASNTDPKPDDGTPITAWPSYGRNRARSMGRPLPLSPYADDDDWGDFEGESQVQSASLNEAEAPPPMMQGSSTKISTHKNSLLDLMDSQRTSLSPPTNVTKQAESLTAEAAAPSNVPPPSVLLSLIINIIQILPTELRDIVTSTSTALMKSVSIANDMALKSLISKIAMIKTFTRILAGRKLRWKRDTHLAQSMRMGPAKAGKTGGMKLAGVDRTESRREDQEAAEVVRLWKQQVGGIKSHIARINAQQSEIEFVLPDVSENVPIRTAKIGEGALTASKCCFLCGLKRDERVARLDVSVEDSFGEWWVDHWGHVDCIHFWEEHKDSLKQHRYHVRT